MRDRAEIQTPLPLTWSQSPHFAQETFSASQTDQHSDLTDEDASIFPNYGNGCCRGFAPRFPDPRFRGSLSARRNRQCTLALCAMICVYSFVAIIIPWDAAFCKRIAEFSVIIFLQRKTPTFRSHFAIFKGAHSRKTEFVQLHLCRMCENSARGVSTYRRLDNCIFYIICMAAIQYERKCALWLLSLARERK